MSVRAMLSPAYLAFGETGEFLLALARRRDLFLPALAGTGHVLRPVDSAAGAPALAWNPRRLAESPKAFWFAPSRVVVRWGADGPRAAEAPGARAVAGLKACDLAALAIVDRVFRDHEFREPAWVAARERTFVVSGDCTDCLDSCFCPLVGGRPWPERGFDLNLSPAEGGWLVDAGSEAGEAFLDETAALLRPARTGEIETRARRRNDLEERVRAQNEEFRTATSWRELVARSERSRLWGVLSATCVECSACNLACPTCHCFLFTDGRADGEAVRVSGWDSCFMAGHARMAGGGTPRLELTERFRNHYFHKFVAFPENWGVTACTGCGRCVEACMGRIDKRDVLRRLETGWIPSDAAEVRR